MKKLTKQEQQRVREWCSSWFGLSPDRRASLPVWIALKLSVDQPTAERYAAWLESVHAKEAQ